MGYFIIYYFITIYLYIFLFVYSFLILYSFLLHFSTFIFFFDLFFALILCFQLVQQLSTALYYLKCYPFRPQILREERQGSPKKKNVEIALFCLCCCVIKVLWIYLK